MKREYFAVNQMDAIWLSDDKVFSRARYFSTRVMKLKKEKTFCTATTFEFSFKGQISVPRLLGIVETFVASAVGLAVSEKGYKKQERERERKKKHENP